MKEKSKLMLLLVLISFLQANETSVVKVKCFALEVQLELPEKSYKYNPDSYVEGVYHDFIFEDTSIITIHRVSNAKRPFNKVNSSEPEILEISDYKVLRYSGFDESKNRYWCEDFYEKLELTAMVTRVKEEDIEKYKDILSSIRVIL